MLAIDVADASCDARNAELKEELASRKKVQTLKKQKKKKAADDAFQRAEKKALTSKQPLPKIAFISKVCCEFEFNFDFVFGISERYEVGETVSIPSEYNAKKYECAIVLDVQDGAAELPQDVKYTLRIHRTGTNVLSDVGEIRPCKLSRRALSQMNLKNVNVVPDAWLK